MATDSTPLSVHRNDHLTVGEVIKGMNEKTNNTTLLNTLLDEKVIDVHLFITVSKNGIELINDPVIGSDHNYSEDADLLLDDLIFYVDFNDYCFQAESKVIDLLEALKL